MSDEVTTTPVTSIEEIMDEVVAGAQAHSAATEIFMDSFVFYGKTLTEWLDEVAINLPDDIQPMDLRQLYVDVARKIQRAANFYTIASAIHGGLVDGGQIKKSDLVKSLVDQYTATKRKRPAATIIERMADSYMNSTVHTRIAAKIVKDFWRERRDTLIEMRKCLEQVSISLHTEMKYQD
tara:strand:+ start:105 stop:644 length:540 start_codon:yes stop_codon:yes gene_type:complete